MSRKTCAFGSSFAADDRLRLRDRAELLRPQRLLHGAHVAQRHRRKRQLGAMFHFYVDVGREAEVCGGDGVHVVDEAADRAQTYDSPPALLYRTYMNTQQYAYASSLSE